MSACGETRAVGAYRIWYLVERSSGHNAWLRRTVHYPLNGIDSVVEQPKNALQ